MRTESWNTATRNMSSETNKYATIKELLLAVISMRSMPKLYSKGHLVRDDVTLGLLLQEFSYKISGRGSHEVWHQEELIGGKPPVVK
jgi:hypothetical protein